MRQTFTAEMSGIITSAEPVPPGTPPARGASNGSGKPGWRWPGWLLDGLRVIAGIGAIYVSYIGLVDRHIHKALHWAVFLLGVFILAHIILEKIVIKLPKTQGKPELVPNPFNSTANVLVTTPAFVLGLLAVFSKDNSLTTVIKVGAVALAAALLLAIVLNGLVSMSDVENPPRSTVIRLLFNLTLWALALGLLSVAMGVVYR